MGGKRRRKRRSKDRFIGESSKKPVRGTPSAGGGGCPEGGVVFLRLSSDPWTHGARCLVVAKWWPSWPVGHVVLPIVVAPPRSGNRDEALFVVEC